MPDVAAPTNDNACKMDLDVSNTTTSTEFPVKRENDMTMTKKPAPGSALWYEIRKENHKKVERRRRETINQAMDDLGAVVPGNEKNKSRILGRAVEYIKALMEENLGLRKQVEQYWEENQLHQGEIAALKAQLKIQEQQFRRQHNDTGDEQEDQQNDNSTKPLSPSSSS